MWYLIAQTAVFILVAAGIGLWLGWYLGKLSRQLEIDVLERRVANGQQDLTAVKTQTAAVEKQLAEQTATLAEHRDRYAVAQAELVELRTTTAAQTSDAEPRAALEAELDALRAATRAQAARLSASEGRCEALAAELDELRGAVAAAPPRHGTDADAALPPAVSAAMARAAAAFAAKPATAAAGRFADSTGASPDDLQKIKGIGPRLAALLNELGVYRYRQIAEFTPADIAWVNERLRFKGRIEREKWVEQARTLAGG